ncbi:protein sidekick-2-like [Mytilus galloprovincialis]|uniref:protein sidekick-2-like n=1 Tax=Mytilus galloprovincialis TaxID=29158 RepID=UPI003F7C41C3
MVGYSVNINLLVLVFQTVYAGSLKDLVVTNIKDTSATIEWTPPNIGSGILNGYRIRFEETGHPKTAFGISVLVSNLNCTVAALSPSTNYTVSLFASTTMGRMLISSTTFKTKDTIG